MINLSKFKFNSYRNIIDHNAPNSNDGMIMAPSAVVEVHIKFAYELKSEEDKMIFSQFEQILKEIKRLDEERKVLAKT